MTFGTISQEEADLHDQTKMSVLKLLKSGADDGDHPLTLLTLAETYAVLLKGEPSGRINAPKK